MAGAGDPGRPSPPSGRPLLMTGAAITGIVVGALDLLRGIVVGVPVVLAAPDVPARGIGLVLLVPLGALALLGGILVLDGRSSWLRWSAAALVVLDLVNAATYAAAGSGLPAVDLLAAVHCCVPLFMLAAARPLSR